MSNHSWLGTIVESFLLGVRGVDVRTYAAAFGLVVGSASVAGLVAAFRAGANRADDFVRTEPRARCERHAPGILLVICPVRFPHPVTGECPFPAEVRDED